MSEAPREDIIEKVRKLLAKTTGQGCTEAEAATALRMASRIMAQHNLAMDEVEAAQNRTEDNWTEDVVDVGHGVSLVGNACASVCQTYFFVRAYYSKRRIDDSWAKATVFFGKPSNVETAKWGYGALRTSAEDLWRRYRTRSNAPAKARVEYQVGVVMGYGMKLREERGEIEAERSMANRAAGTGSGTTLATIDNKMLAAFNEAHGKLGKHRGKLTAGGGEAFHDGIRAGKELNLARPVAGKSNKQITG